MVERQHRVPVEPAEQPVGDEMGGLGEGLALQIELQPGLAGQLHLGEQQEALVRHDVGHLPEIQGIADTQGVAHPPAAVQAVAAHQLVHQAAHPPEEVVREPAVLAAQADHGREHPRRRQTGERHLPLVTEDGAARLGLLRDVAGDARARVAPAADHQVVLEFVHGLTHALGKGRWSDLREILAGMVVLHQGLGLEPLHQSRAHLVRHRGHQGEPVGAEPRAEQRHRYDQPPQTEDARGLAQHRQEAHGRRADIDHQILGRVQAERRGQVGDHVVDADGLGEGLHPAGGDHQRQFLHQVADHLEAGAARTDDHPGAEPQGADPVGPAGEDLAGLDAAGQVLGGGLAQPQAAEVDDLFDAAGDGRVAEVLRAHPVEPAEIAARAHGVDEVVGGVHALQRLVERLVVEGVAFDHLGAAAGFGGELAGVAYQQAELHVRLFTQDLFQAPADVAGGSGQEDNGHELSPSD